MNAAALILLASGAHASQSLDLVLDLAKSKAYLSKSVDWSSVERQARIIETQQGEDQAIRFVVAALSDRHTSYRAPASPIAAPSGPPAIQPEIAKVLPSIDLMPVLQINRWAGKDQVGATKAVRSALGQVMERQPCGLILDFSANSGGNMWPMLVGLSPLLSDGRLGAFRSADGTTNKIEKLNGLITLGGKPHFLNYPRIAASQGAAPHIAIIIGDKSASSGEITPLMFYGQENVEFFGHRSAGFTSANQVFPLPNGGTLVLTTAMTEDRNGRTHPDGIKPDIASAQPFEDSARWLSQQCSR